MTVSSALDFLKPKTQMGAAQVAARRHSAKMLCARMATAKHCDPYVAADVVYKVTSKYVAMEQCKTDVSKHTYRSVQLIPESSQVRPRRSSEPTCKPATIVPSRYWARWAQLFTQCLGHAPPAWWGVTEPAWLSKRLLGTGPAWLSFLPNDWVMPHPLGGALQSPLGSLNACFGTGPTWLSFLPNDWVMPHPLGGAFACLYLGPLGSALARCLGRNAFLRMPRALQAPLGSLPGKTPVWVPGPLGSASCPLPEVQGCIERLHRGDFRVVLATANVTQAMRCCLHLAGEQARGTTKPSFKARFTPRLEPSFPIRCSPALYQQTLLN